jgi:hypothetical protein
MNGIRHRVKRNASTGSQAGVTRARNNLREGAVERRVHQILQTGFFPVADRAEGSLKRIQESLPAEASPELVQKPGAENVSPLQTYQAAILNPGSPGQRDESRIQAIVILIDELAEQAIGVT